MIYVFKFAFCSKVHLQPKKKCTILFSLCKFVFCWPFVDAKITQNPKIWIRAQKLTEWHRYVRKLNQDRNPFNMFFFWPEGRGSWADWRFCCQSGLVWWSVGVWEPWRLSDILRIAPKTKSIFSLIIDERPIDFGWACVFQGLPVADGVTYDLIASHITISW